MADQYGLTPEDYVDDLELLSNRRYCQGMLIHIVLFSKQGLKPFQVITAALMTYDFIYHIPQQVRLSIHIQFPHIYSFPDSVPPRACFLFNGQLSPLTYEIKWSKLHVIYFSILIINWTGIM